MLDMQDALLPPSLPPIAPRRPLCCSCSFGTPRSAPEFESRGERERLSAFSLSYVRSRVPAFHAPAPGRSGDAAGLRTNTKLHRTMAQQRPRARSLRHTTQQHSSRRTAAQCRRARWVGWGGWAGGGGAWAVPGTSYAVCAFVVCNFCTRPVGRVSCLRRPLARRSAPRRRRP